MPALIRDNFLLIQGYLKSIIAIFSRILNCQKAIDNLTIFTQREQTKWYISQVLSRRERMRGRVSFCTQHECSLKYNAGAVWKVSLKCSHFQPLSCMLTKKLLNKNMFIHLFIQSFNKYLLCASLVPGTAQSFQDTENVTENFLSSQKIHYYCRMQADQKQVKMNKTSSERDWC